MPIGQVNLNSPEMPSDEPAGRPPRQGYGRTVERNSAGSGPAVRSDDEARRLRAAPRSVRRRPVLRLKPGDSRWPGPHDRRQTEPRCSPRSSYGDRHADRRTPSGDATGPARWQTSIHPGSRRRPRSRGRFRRLAVRSDGGARRLRAAPRSVRRRPDRWRVPRACPCRARGAFESAGSRLARTIRSRTTWVKLATIGSA